MLAHSFEPIYTEHAEILILGSMPGRASINENQYYAHPRNLFWSLVSSSRQARFGDSYASKIAMLTSQRIALWDVLKRCEREGSLDVDIQRHTEVANELGAIVARLHRLKRICFNGQKAHQIFMRHFKHSVFASDVEYFILPSSSPANASQGFSQKQQAWREALTLDENHNHA